MIELFFWPTPNGMKIRIALEELGLPHRLTRVNIGANEQFDPAFLRISPNNKMPAIVDHGAGGQSVFESGAILIYLAEKTGRLLPREGPGRIETLEWLFWQVGGFGPMLGQNHHFNRYAPVKVPYAIERYNAEARRLYGVLDRRLEGRVFLAGGAFSIADVAVYPWARVHEHHGIDLKDYPSVARWVEGIGSRESVSRAYAD